MKSKKIALSSFRDLRTFIRSHRRDTSLSCVNRCPLGRVWNPLSKGSGRLESDGGWRVHRRIRDELDHKLNGEAHRHSLERRILLAEEKGGFFWKRIESRTCGTERAMAVVRDAIAGAVSGAAGVAVGHPLDTIKTRLQTCPVGTYKSALHCARVCVQENGFRRGLMAGVTFPALARAADKAVHFGFRRERAEGLTSQAVSGLTAGILGSFITCPAELVKVQMQLAPSSSTQKGAISCARAIISVQGWRGMFRGFNATVTRDAPAISVWLLTYDAVLNVMQGIKGSLVESHGVTAAEAVVAGGTAGIVGWCVSFPLDVIKSRIQAVDLVTQKVGESPAITAVAKKIFQEGGARMLYAGLGPCLLRAVPVNATMFATYEGIRNLLS